MKLYYIIIPLIVIFVASVGSMLTAGGIGSGWYYSLALPSWTPPGDLISLVWITLFVLAMIAVFSFWHASMPLSAGKISQKRFKLIVILFSINAFLNIFWSYLFFSQHAIGLAFLEAILLGVSVILLIIFLWRISRQAAVLLIPYVVWVLFASFLTLCIWAFN